MSSLVSSKIGLSVLVHSLFGCLSCLSQVSATLRVHVALYFNCFVLPYFVFCSIIMYEYEYNLNNENKIGLIRGLTTLSLGSVKLMSV